MSGIGRTCRKQLRPLASALRNARDRALGGACAVLLYHRVIDIPTDPQLLAVKPLHFDAHLALLKKRYRVLTVEEFNHHLLGRKRFPRCSVLITFDDGYADNHYAARPLLEKHGAQALFYIASGYIGSGREYWWDELERLLLLNEHLPERMAFAMDRVRIAWSAEAGDLRRQAQLAYADQLNVMRGLPAGKREKALDELRTILGPQAQRRSHLPMTVDELKQFTASPSVEIGAHTQWHPSLAQVDEAEQHMEVSGSKKDLEQLLGREVKYFSYPFGTGADFNTVTERIAREAGFLHTAANYPGFVHARSPLYRFPRFLVRDWDEAEFARRMEGFMRP